MARRKIGAAPTEKKWKKIARMNADETSKLIKHLENNNQLFSKIYGHALDHLGVLQKV